MLWGSADSPAKGSTAMGIWLAPPPMISMVSWAWAAPARTIHAAKNVAVRFIRGKSIPPSFPSLVRPELQVEVALELLGPVGPGERRAFQDRPLDRLVVGLVAARFSEPRREHFAGRQLHDIEDRLRVCLQASVRSWVQAVRSPATRSKVQLLQRPGASSASAGRRPARRGARGAPSPTAPPG